MVLFGAGWAVKLGWQPFRSSKPDEPSKSAGVVFNVSSSNQSGGITAGQVIQQPPRRDLSTEAMRAGLLALLNRGRKVQVVGLVEPNAMQFQTEIEKFLLAQGFDVLDPDDFMLGGAPFYGQNVYEEPRLGITVIEIGYDDGSRVWKHAPSMTAAKFHGGGHWDPRHLRSIDRTSLGD